MGYMIFFNVLSAGDSELLQVNHAAREAGRGGRVVPGLHQQEQLQRPAKALEEQETEVEQHKWEVVQLEEEHGAREIVEETEEDGRRVEGAASQQDEQQQQAEPVADEEKEQTVAVTDKSLPPCKRTMLFKMAGKSSRLFIAEIAFLTSNTPSQASTVSAPNSTSSFAPPPLPGVSTTPSSPSTRAPGTTATSPRSSQLPLSPADRPEIRPDECR